MISLTTPKSRKILNHLLEEAGYRKALLPYLSNLIDSDIVSHEEYLSLFQKYVVLPP